MSEDYRQFSSYNGLDRVPQFLGLPMSAFLILFVVSALMVVIGIKLFGVVGFLFISLGFPAFLFLKSITATDDQAVRILLLEMKFISKRHLYKEFGNTLTFQSTKYLSHDNIQQNLEKNVFYDR